MKLLALLTLGLVVAVGGTAIATDADRDRPPAPAVGGQLADTIDPVARAAVSTLAAQRTAADVIPARYARTLRERAAFGANPDLSRLAIAQTSQSLYFVPGDDHVCFVLTYPDDRWGSSCATSDDIEAGRAGPMTHWFDDHVVLAGIVPDGVDDVRVDGSPKTSLEVENNAYYAVFPTDEAPTAVSYTAPDGDPVTWELPNPNDP